MMQQDVPRLIIVMGVSGCGKTTVAQQLAHALGAYFVEADDFHPPQNIALMQRGIALTDEQRAPWIDALCEHILHCQDACVVMAYSGLRRAHRQRFRALGRQVQFVWLHAPMEHIYQRMQQRLGHFMPASLLASQFASLELPHQEPDIVQINADAPPARVLEDIYTCIGVIA